MRNLLILFAAIWLLPSAPFAQCGPCRGEVNHVANGNFSAGNSGFASDLNYVTGLFNCPLCPENTYTVGANAFFFHSGFSGSDHTNPPSGLFFIANGPGQAGSSVWCQTFNVEPNNDYTFTFWACDVTNNNNPHPQAWLQASFNGVLSSDTLIADGDWEMYSTIWNSGSNTTLDLCIINQQWQTGGNDFGLDDISFVGCEDIHLSHQANAGSDIVVCSEATATLGAPGYAGYNYSWTPSLGLNSATAANPIFQLSNHSGDTLTSELILTVDSANVGCVTYDTVLVHIVSLPELDLGPDTAICMNTSIPINIGDYWQEVDWNNGEVSYFIDAYPGTYYLDCYLNNCVAHDTLVIYEIPMPIFNFGGTIEGCETNPPLLFTGVTSLWSTGATAPSIIATESGVYYATYTEGDCISSDTAYVTVYESPYAGLPADTSFCQGTALTLQSASNGTWSTGVGGSSIDVNLPGTYSINMVNGLCTTFESVEVYMDPLPFAWLPEDSLICEGETITLDVFANQNETYNWSTADTTSEIHVNQPGTYTVVVSNACGSDEATVILDTYLCDWNIYIPNSFSPNGDDHNPGWRAYGYNITNYDLTIFNRFGDAVFHTDNIDEEWIPDLGVGQDVYNYRIQAITFDNDVVTRLGHIYLVR